jgi:hypothetical protein
MIEDKFNSKNKKQLEKFAQEKFGVKVEVNKLKPNFNNYFVRIMDSIIC